MKKTTLALCLISLLATPLMAETTNEEQRLAQLENNVANLQREMASISGNLEQIVALLQTKSPASTKATLATTVENGEVVIEEQSPLVSENENHDLSVFDEAKAEEPQKQGLLLDVYVYEEYKKLPDEPKGIPMATLEYSRDGAFHFNEHINDEDLKSFAFTQPVGLHFHGYINAPKKGNYVFSNMLHNKYTRDSSHDEYSSTGKCQASIFIDDEKITSTGLKNTRYKEKASDQAMVKLEGGFVKFDYWITCVRDSLYPLYTEETLRGIDSQVKVKTPSSGKLTNIPKDMFFHY